MKFELQPYHRNVSDAELLADLIRVARKLGVQTMTQETYTANGAYSAATVKKRMGWNAALEAAGLISSKSQNVAQNLVLEDIRRVAESLGTRTLKRSQYRGLGKYSETPVHRMFGDWDSACRAAGLEHEKDHGFTNEELFDNLECVWRHLGRQPTVTDMHRPLSRFSSNTYANRFGGYRQALQAFVDAIECRDPKSELPAKEQPPSSGTPDPIVHHRTARNVNWRLRFLTLRQDGFRCRACGRSPATQPGIELEVDHVKPWSDGGETELANLQSLCQKCNGGKSNLPWTVE